MTYNLSVVETITIPVLSSAHLDPKSVGILEGHAASHAGYAEEFSDLTVAGFAHGWFVMVPPEDAEVEISDCLGKIFAAARNWGWTCILFDRDANPVEDLETYDW